MQLLNQNPLTRTDSYKPTQWWQYPPKTQVVYSYLESRGGFFNTTLFSGLQYYTKLLSGQFFTRDDVFYAEDFAKKHYGTTVNTFNKEGWLRMFDKYNGRLPLRVKAVREGEVVEGQNVLMTVENTDEEFWWITNWTESMWLKVWYPITVGTLSREIRQVIGRALDRTGDPSLLNFKLHDFGYRGVSSDESSAIGGFAHLINFMGTDTMAAIELARQYYNNDMAGFSIPASEHSTITSWGQENEVFAYKNMLDHVPDGLVACVSDSYDIRNAVEKLWGGTLRDQVMGRTGTLIVRPDSGDPIVVLEDVFNALWERFGGTVNNKGWKVIAPCVRVIQGDGVNYHTIQNMTSQLTRKGWSQDNWGYGMGGALLQQLNRDTLRFAFKCSAVKVDGRWRDVHKDPKTDPTKASKRGRFQLLNDGRRYFTADINDKPDQFGARGDFLETVFENGEVLIDQTLDDIRTRARSYDNFKEATA